MKPTPSSVTPLFKPKECTVIDLREADTRSICLLPLYTASVRAGFPSPADDHLEQKLDLNQHLIDNPASTFFANVKGDSMIGAGISEGDMLIIDRSLEPVHGKIVVAVINSEMTLKRLHKTKTECYLAAENPAYPNIPIKECDEVTIWGVVIHVIKSF